MQKIMNKVGSLLLAVMTTAALFTGCGKSEQSATADSSAQGQDSRLSVYASFYPMADFAAKIGGGKVTVTTMVPAGTEPHDWEPSAADVAGLEKANVFVYNGLGIESWAEDVLAALQNSELTTVEASQGLQTLKGGEEGGRDPHVWLSPLNAKQEMENIKNALVKADPSNAQLYEDNYQKYAAEADRLDEEFKAVLSPLPKKEVIVSHEAFGYLCDAYGLTQVGIEGLSPDSEPDPARMTEIIAFAKEHDVRVIFFEELVSPKVAETIAAETGAKTQVLNPLEGLSDEQLAAGDDYFSVMRQNLEALKAALE